MRPGVNLLWLVGIAAAMVAAAPCPADEPVVRTESFDRDPNWDCVNNRPADRGNQPVEDVMINGRKETFGADPKWEDRNNRTTYRTNNVRPRFDSTRPPPTGAGASPSRWTGGRFIST